MESIRKKAPPFGEALNSNGSQVASGNVHAVIEIDILDGLEQFRPFVHRTLEGFAAGDKTHAAGAFVDHRGAHRLTKASARTDGISSVSRVTIISSLRSSCCSRLSCLGGITNLA